MDKIIVFDFETADLDTIMNLTGVNDEHLRIIAEEFGVDLEVSDSHIVTSSYEYADEIRKILKEMKGIYDQKKELLKEDVVNVVKNGASRDLFRSAVAKGIGSRSFYLRTRGQKILYEAINSHDITIVTGPAGTGKTFLAVVYAVNKLREGLVRKIIITLPVVEAGESLGFLPGDLKEKVDPYLIPIYDSLEMLLGKPNVEKMMEKGIIEVAPLAYMRGRTLNDAIVILDEAQNTTAMQIKMFLTRLGFNSKMVITGDITQIDLPNNKPSGLVKAIEIVRNIEGIAVVEMHRNDVVRHPLVQKIIEAYEKQG